MGLRSQLGEEEGNTTRKLLADHCPAAQSDLAVFEPCSPAPAFLLGFLLSGPLSIVWAGDRSLSRPGTKQRASQGTGPAASSSRKAIAQSQSKSR